MKQEEKERDKVLFLCLFIYLFWPCWVLAVARGVLVAACGTLSCSMWTLSCGIRTPSCGMLDLVPHPGIEPGPPASGGQSPTHWTTREVLTKFYKKLGVQVNTDTSNSMRTIKHQRINSSPYLPALVTLFFSRGSLTPAIICSRSFAHSYNKHKVVSKLLTILVWKANLRTRV